MTIRDQTNLIEQIGVKRAFVHPLYKNPSLYYDIALYELDRRILYSSNLTIYKDTPACLQKGSAPQSVMSEVAAGLYCDIGVICQ